LIRLQSTLAFGWTKKVSKMSQILLVLFFGLQITLAQKCLLKSDGQNAFKTVVCNNVVSMNDIATEIRGNWTSVKVINDANHAQFSNVAGKII
jgi:hypothetical protein